MNDLTLYKFSNQNIHVIQDKNGDPWFCLKEVCGILEISNHRMASNL